MGLQQAEIIQPVYFLPLDYLWCTTTNRSAMCLSHHGLLLNFDLTNMCCPAFKGESSLFEVKYY